MHTSHENQRNKNKQMTKQQTKTTTRYKNSIKISRVGVPTARN